jgi:hypothetical protein
MSGFAVGYILTNCPEITSYIDYSRLLIRVLVLIWRGCYNMLNQQNQPPSLSSISQTHTPVLQLLQLLHWSMTGVQSEIVSADKRVRGQSHAWMEWMKGSVVCPTRALWKDISLYLCSCMFRFTGTLRFCSQISLCNERRGTLQCSYVTMEGGSKREGEDGSHGGKKCLLPILWELNSPIPPICTSTQVIARAHKLLHEHTSYCTSTQVIARAHKWDVKSSPTAEMIDAHGVCVSIWSFPLGSRLNATC